MSLTKKYSHKIKTADELKKIIGPLPRAKKVIMCHGVFDVVHPGHLRHLLFAKEKAQILIASITSDKFVTKDKYRPYVPQELRAANLAALEMVDYVIIDNNPEPLNNLKLLKPDFFGKGYEYSSHVVNSKTGDESKILESYGGKIIFTPGDIIYSSTALINSDPPSIGLDKLMTLMEKEKIKFQDLKETLKNLSKATVHVIGDTIVDSYTHTSIYGGQNKTPTPSVRYENRKDYVGGAGIVSKHIRATGAKVIFSTVLGDDQYTKFVLKDLKKTNVESKAIIDSTRPTTNKNVIIAANHRIAKIDTLDNNAISDAILNQLVQSTANTKCDAVIFSDFRHGIFNKRSIKKLIGAIPEKTYKVADSQVATRWGNILDFPEFDLITPNEKEARFSLGDQDSGIRPLAAALYDSSKCKTLILKLGAKGVIVCKNNSHEDLNSFFVVESFSKNAIDPVGAGDALLAYSTLSMLATKSEAISAILGSLAAACECEFNGNIPVFPQNVLNKIKEIEKQAEYSG